MAAHRILSMAGASTLALLVLAATLRAQPPSPFPTVPETTPAYPYPGAFPPPSVPVADPNQITPGIATSAQHNFALSYDPGVDPVEEVVTHSYIGIDFLSLKAHFGQKDLAYTQTGGTNAGTYNFDQRGFEFAPRITLRLMPFDEFGISGSFFKFSDFAQNFGFTNSNPSTVFTSAPFPFVPSTVASTTSGSVGRLPSIIVVPFNNFVQSPAPFYFASLLPKVALNGGNPGTFGYTSNVQGGFPDQLQFRTTSTFQTADLKLDRTWQIGEMRGTIGLGAQYLSFSHSYSVDRFNAGGPLPTHYDFQDADDDLFQVDPASRFDDGPDFDHFFYGYHYEGVGPKLALEGTWPPTGAVQFFAKVGGAVAFGGRKEVTTVSSTQNGAFHDHDGAEAFADLVFSRSLSFRAEHNTFVAIPMAEAEAGVSYAPTDWAVKPLIKVSIIAQYYDGGGSDLDPNAGIFLYGVNATAALQF